MRIAIDGNEANVTDKVGVHQYAFEVLWSIYKVSKSGKHRHTFIIYLKNNPNKDLPEENDWWQYNVLTGGRVWILTKLMPHLLFNKTSDVLFIPSHYTPIVTRLPVVATIHDLGYLESSEQFKKYDFWQLKHWTAKTIQSSKALIAVSESTRKDIVRHSKVDPKKIHVVHHGYDPHRFNTNISANVVRHVKKKYGIDGEYILFLSMLKPSKNIEGLLEAFSILTKQSKRKIKLVIAGKKGWLYETIYRVVRKLKLEDNVIFTGFVDESDKPALYYGSRLFTLPVFWEGFGMTALESIACGTPVLASKVGGLPEVLDKDNKWVNPYDATDIARGMETILSLSDTEYKSLVKKGISQASKFSWEKSAKETLKVLESVVK